jgi:hypothetical protein
MTLREIKKEVKATVRCLPLCFKSFASCVAVLHNVALEEQGNAMHVTKSPGRIKPEMTNGG